MSKKDKSRLSRLHLKGNLKERNKENHPDIIEEKYTAKNFVDHLTLLIETGSDSLYSEKVDTFYKINDLVDLRLINKKTYIYINDKRFIQCFHILFNIETNNIQRYERIRNIDEASQLLRNRFGKLEVRITPEEVFMGHCSNIQAFFENGLNTDILHSNIAFPLLKKLVRSGYKPAERVFKEEIVKRYNEGTWNSRMFLKSEGYLNYLDKEEKGALKEDINSKFEGDIGILEKIFDRTYQTEVILDKDLRTVKVGLTEIEKKSNIRDIIIFKKLEENKDSTEK